MSESIQVLDHGFVRFVEAWGKGDAGGQQQVGEINHTGQVREPILVEDFECGIIEAARQSTQGSFRGWEPAACDCEVGRMSAGAVYVGPVDTHMPDCARRKSPGDKNLLRYLYEHEHNTPFEFAGMVIEVQAPIFVFREWHRHRTQSYNEMSARYSPLPDLYYLPTAERLLMSGGPLTKQSGSTGQVLEESRVPDVLASIRDQYARAESVYKAYLDLGVPKELARVVMPVGHYSKMRAHTCLRNWLAFMTLRCDPKAQWEIRQYADAVATLIGRHFPRTYNLWLDTGFLE